MTNAKDTKEASEQKVSYWHYPTVFNSIFDKLRYTNVPLLLSFFGIFVNKSNSTELTIASCTSKSDLFLTRFKFVSYLEKAVRKKEVKNMREAN